MEPIVQEIKNSKGVSIMKKSDRKSDRNSDSKSPSKPYKKSHISSLKNLLETNFVSCNSTEELPVGWFKSQINSVDYFYKRKTGERRWHHPCGCTCDKYLKYPIVKTKPIISTHIGRLKECDNQPKRSKIEELSQMEIEKKEQKDRRSKTMKYLEQKRRTGVRQAEVLSRHSERGQIKKRSKSKNRRRTNNKKETKNKFSLKNSKKRMISKKKYKELIQKRQHNKKLSLNERKKLDHALFINYCSCVKSLKYDSKVKDYLEYPVCMSSIYKKRGFNPPKGVTVRCKKYK